MPAMVSLVASVRPKRQSPAWMPGKVPSKRPEAGEARVDEALDLVTPTGDAMVNRENAQDSPVETLVGSKRRFLRFLEGRIGNRADAEDVLQVAFVKLMERGDSLRDQEKLVPWFYQLLRNLIADHYRHRGATVRMEEALTAGMAQTAAQPDEELFRAVCSCVNDVIAVLKPQDARLIRSVELENEPVAQAAKEIGITPGNASVRLHRARRALREGLQTMCGVCAEHGCLDCTCTKKPSP